MSDNPAQPCVLVVEDDDQVRGLVQTLLSNEGYRLLAARSGTEALQMIESQECDIQLLLSDMLLPGVSGYDLAVKLRERNPQLKVILMTGYVEGEIVQRCIEELNATFLDKPFKPGELRQIVRETAASLDLTARTH